MLESEHPNPSFTIKVKTPDGTLFVTIIEENETPRQIIMIIGKAGTRIQAWADALGRMITLLLQSNTDIYAILQEISGITTANRATHISGVNIRSGPEGLAYAIMVYIKERNRGRHERIARLDDGGFRALE